MTPYLIGPILIGIGAAILYYGFPERHTEDHDDEEEWATTNPLPPTQCDRCGGGREVWVDDYLAVPCPWCARKGAA